MGYWLATAEDAQQQATLKRFDARFWTVNFPRPMMAAATTRAANAVRVDACFYKANDLAGLIWESEDRHDHPLLAYETARDYRGVTLAFRWRSGGLLPLNAVYGPTLTLEGRDAQGHPKSWYVRLWNYATGTPEDAQIELDFDALSGGFLLPSEADPVWPRDIDRMVISLVPPGYTGADVPLAAPKDSWADLSDIRCTGPGSTLNIGDVLVPPAGLSIATGYDDSYHLTPERVLRTAFLLGYRGVLNHYVGMSHYFRLANRAGQWEVTATGGALNVATTQWHRDFATRAKAYGYALILSLSFELFDAHCPQGWKQRAANGDPALTGWVPPSTLLSPANAEAMGYLKAVARAFMTLAVAAGHAPQFQIGEPWWWIMPDGRICLYDAAAKAALGGAPAILPSLKAGPLAASHQALLDAAGAILGRACLDLMADLRAAFPNSIRLLLVYLPSVLDPAMPEARRANLPSLWAAPAFDILQIEDYEWVTTGNDGARAQALAQVQRQLGYGPSRQHYLSGFVLKASDADQWQRIEAAAHAAQARGVAATLIWAMPQVVRDGFTVFQIGEPPMNAFDDVSFPLAIGRQAQVMPSYSTAIVTSASGHEQRNAAWTNGRLRFDAGPGLRSEADIQTLIGFFRARRGAAKAFRFRDPLDNSSRGMTGAPQPDDIRIGTGDGTTRRFALIKTYGSSADAEIRRITRPVASSVQVAINGTRLTSGWALDPGGWIRFDTPPPAAAAVTAGFLFDVPVRFEQDQLDVTSHSLLAGEVASVPLIEVRDA